jgi:hypothetical protein
MDATTRKRLVRQWKRFAATIEEAWEEADDTSSGVDIAAVIDNADLEVRVIRTRAVYLRGLLYAGIVDPLASPPTDERLWETHPINASADLYEED